MRSTHIWRYTYLNVRRLSMSRIYRSASDLSGTFALHNKRFGFVAIVTRIELPVRTTQRGYHKSALNVVCDQRFTRLSGKRSR